MAPRKEKNQTPKDGKRKSDEKATPSKVAKTEVAAAATAEVESQSAEVQQPDANANKKQKKAVAAVPKRDKNAPLARSNTPRELVDEEGRVLRLISVNVAGLRAVLNNDKAAASLRKLVERERPDVFCLNEHKLKQDDVEDCEKKLKELLPKEYTTAKIHWSVSTAKKGYSGVAIFLRQPSGDEMASAAIPDPSTVLVTEGMGSAHEKDPIISAEGRVLTMELPEVMIVCTYVPNSGQDLQRLSYRTDRKAAQCWDRALGDYVNGLKQSKSKPAVVIGDLNCCHRVQDIWNMSDRPDFPEGLAQKPLTDQYTGLSACKKAAGLTPEERESFGKLLADADLVDTFRAKHPDATGVFSYFSQRVVQNRPLNRGLRLDYVLASSSMCTQLTGNAADTTSTASVPQVLDSFILDKDELIADHAAIGCSILLPS
jgi:exodeoxyribonuclease III